MNITEKLNKLPENVREYVCSNDVRLMMEQSCFLYGVDEVDIEKIASTIGDIFFAELQLSQLPLMLGRNLNIDGRVAHGIACELSARIFVKFETYFEGASTLLKQWSANKIPPIVSEEKAWKKVLDIEPWILEEEKEKKEEAQKEQAKIAKQQAKIEKINLDKALKLYPGLGEQSITSNPLKLRYFPAPVRSSIKNWITDYHDALGAGKHSTMDRGNYLFHSENGKKLTPAERQKMSLVLKSLDEETMLDIDVDRQVIIFEVAKPLLAKVENFPNTPTSSSNNNSTEIAQARIRQSLDFSNSQNVQAGRNQDAPVFAFEDSDYANVLRAKNKGGSEETFGNFASEKKQETEKPAFGDLSFSSAQELPVEKKFATPVQNSISKFSMPTKQVKTELPRNPQTWNSPNFKQTTSFATSAQPTQLQTIKNHPFQAQPAQAQSSSVEVQQSVPIERRSPVQPKNHSPYVITPLHKVGNAFQNEPKVQGNTVDLS